MKRTMFMSVVLAAAVSIGCNETARNDVGNDIGGPDGSIGTTGDVDTAVTNADKDFIDDLAIAGMAEVELGKMAAEKGSNAQVKNFGKMMVDDHTMAGDKLKMVASQHNVIVPNALDETHQQLRDRLAQLSGAEFDREYMDAMVDGHEDVVDQLGSRVDEANPSAVVAEQSDNVVTSAINRWAAESYPVVQKHLENAKMIASNLDRTAK
jgi:putative membrane protein